MVLKELRSAFVAPSCALTILAVIQASAGVSAGKTHWKWLLGFARRFIRGRHCNNKLSAFIREVARSRDS